MRSDYALYVVAIICFIVAICTTTMNLQTSLYIYAIVVLGIIFMGLGYIARPKKVMLSPATTALPAPPPESLPEKTVKPEKQATKKRARKKKTTRSREKKT